MQAALDEDVERVASLSEEAIRLSVTTNDGASVEVAALPTEAVHDAVARGLEVPRYALESVCFGGDAVGKGESLEARTTVQPPGCSSQCS